MDRDHQPSGRSRPGSPGEREQSAGGLGGLALAGLGFQFAASLLVFYYGGQWLDRRLGTAPVFLLVGVFVGAGASFYAMYRQLMAAQRRDDAARRSAGESASGSTGQAPGNER